MIKSDFNKNVFRVFSGTFIAQIIGIGVYPILTRIYTPTDFSNLALYLSIVTIISSISSLKYEKAIIIPKDDYEAMKIVKLSFYLTSLIGLITMILYLTLGDKISLYLGLESIKTWLIFVPITIIMTGFYMVINIWFNRKKKYNLLSKNRILTSGVNGVLKIGIQLTAKLGAFGLVLSEAIGQLFSLLFFGKKIVKDNYKEFKYISFSELRTTAKKYKSFPIYSLPADFLLISARELPVFLLASYYGAGIVGFYMLTKKILDAPFTLISSSILEVFRQKATEDYYELGTCKNIFVSTFKKLVLFAIIPFTLLYFIAPWLFNLVFGDEWIQAGYYAQILIIMYFFKFISSPLTYIFFIVNRLRLNSILQLIFFSVSFLSLFLGDKIFNKPDDTLLVYSISTSFVYIMYLFISYRLASKTRYVE